MRVPTFALAGLSLWSQPLPAPILVQPVENDALRRALAPVEQWLQSPLVIFVDTALIPTPEPGEALMANGVVYVPLTRLRALRYPFEAAEFLSHAAAHNKLDHAARYTEAMRTFEQIAIMSPHFPQASMEAALRVRLEKEAEPLAAEFLAQSGCTPRRCDLFKRLLDAVK